MILVSIRMRTNFLSFENVSNECIGVRNVFVVRKRATRRKSTYSKGLGCSVPHPLGVTIFTIVLVRSPIVGCEGIGVRRLYSHRRQHIGHFSNVILGTRSFTEGNIKGHRGTTIFY